MDRHAGVFLCGAFAQPAIHPEKRQESSVSGTTTVSAVPVTFLETPRRPRTTPLSHLGQRCRSQFLHCEFPRQDRLRRLLPSDRVVSSPPCTLQYSFSTSPSSASRLRVRNQKTSFNEAMHNANDTKTTIASASNSPVREPKA